MTTFIICCIIWYLLGLIGCGLGVYFVAKRLSLKILLASLLVSLLGLITLIRVTYEIIEEYKDDWDDIIIWQKKK